MSEILWLIDDYIYSSRPLFFTSFLSSMPILENPKNVEIYGGTFVDASGGTTVHSARSGMKNYNYYQTALSNTSAL